ncbi:MAG: hypothetical protein INH12_29595 [Cupriavidus sp.]|uniref:hypothetical protein n=1 Tax=Cupriavidus sp. TaxID=1873897 RepID=UPI0025BD7C4B|nr:hypothetical protein [Cupriavidus sp.]MCA3184640.1 hypothetical protein [Cupriavidus sp.]MCA3194225.1 hypothetical protein [Cupriavidus sp.]
MAKLRDWLARYRAKFILVGHRMEAVTVLILLLGGGMGTGYLFCVWQYRELMAQQRDDHQAEIARLQEAYTQTLAALTPKVAAAANASAQAAEASVEAAKSVKRAARPVPPPAAVARPLTEAERQDVNRDIEAANRKVREARK